MCTHRLNGYQTSSPFRDFVLNCSWDVNDRREVRAHSELQKLYERRSEWFKCTPEPQEVVSGLKTSMKNIYMRKDLQTCKDQESRKDVDIDQY